MTCTSLVMAQLRISFFRAWFLVDLLQAITFNCCISDIDARNPHCDALHGRHFIVGAIEQTPYINIRSRNSTGCIDVQGYSNEIIRFLARDCNFTFEHAEPVDRVMGAIVNGSWNGLVGMLLKGEADLASSGITITQSRSTVIDFSNEIQIDPISLLIPYPKRDNSIGRMARPFGLEVWVLTVGSLLTCSFAMTLINKLEARWKAAHKLAFPFRNYEKIRRCQNFSENFMLLLSSLINPGKRLPNFGAASIAVLTTWCLATVVITNSYTTSVKSYLTAPKFFPMIRSLDDVAYKHSSRFLVEKHNSIWFDIMSGSSGTYAQIAAALHKHPENALTSLKNLENSVALENKVFAQRKSLHLRKMFDDLKLTGKCRLYIAEKDMFIGLSSFGLKKNNYLTRFLNQEILWMHQFGFTSYLSNHHFWPRKTQCSAPIATRPATQNEKLTLNYLFGAFLLLCLGIVSAIFAFLAELVIFSWNLKRQFAKRIHATPASVPQ